MLSIQILFFLCLLLAGALLHPLAERLKLPLGIFLILIGFGAAGLVTSWGFDTGLRWYNVHPLILNVLLPVLIFQAALQLDISNLRRHAVAIILLALPLMLLGIGITAVLLYYGIGHATGFPWVIAWLAAALLSATDPSAVVGILRRLGADHLATIVESEGLLNYVAAIVLFTLLVAAASTGAGATFAWFDPVLQFLIVFSGGLAVGAVAGMLAIMMLRLIHNHYTVVTMTLVVAYAATVVAEHVLQVSSVIAMLVCGLVIGEYLRRQAFGLHDTVQDFWGLAGFLAGSSIFLLAGMTITLGMFSHQYLAMLIAIGAVMITRALNVLVLLPLALRLVKRSGLDMRDHIVTGWAGVRGAVTLALALSLPLEVTSWYTVQSMAYGVVLFTLFIQATTLYPLGKSVLTCRLDKHS